jgi:alpha-2-macroglobulin
LHVIGKVLQKLTVCSGDLGHDLDTIFASISMRAEFGFDLLSPVAGLPTPWRFPGRIIPMLSLLRAGFAAVLTAVCLAVVCTCASAATTKPFADDDLATGAVQFEAQLKSDVGAPAKTVDQLKRDSDAAFAKNDFRTGMTLLEQVVVAAPNDAATWLRLAHTIQQIRPGNANEAAMLLQRASSVAYIAYQRATDRNQEADSLAFLGTLLSQQQIWRPALDALRLSLEQREVAAVRGQYERLRDQYGFRVLNYTIDADTASPRACFQFSEDMPARTDF